jgi:hypothetical protein
LDRGFRRSLSDDQLGAFWAELPELLAQEIFAEK